MCGIVGVIGRSPVNQLIYDALLLLQHHGQDAAGIVTMWAHLGGALVGFLLVLYWNKRNRRRFY